MGKRSVKANSTLMEIEPGTTAGSLKERLGADQDDWVFELSADRQIRLIPDHDPIPEDADNFAVVPHYGEWHASP